MYIHPETSHKWRTMTRVNDTKNFGQARFRQLVLNIKMNHMQWVWLRIKINVISRPRGNFTWPEQRILIQFTDGFGGKKWREKINLKNLAGKFGAKKNAEPNVPNIYSERQSAKSEHNNFLKILYNIPHGKTITPWECPGNFSHNGKGHNEQDDLINVKYKNLIYIQGVPQKYTDLTLVFQTLKSRNLFWDSLYQGGYRILKSGVKSRLLNAWQTNPPDHQ